MADIFENESEVLQDSSYRAHLNRNWQKGNDEFRAINERISKVNQNESNNSEIIASHIDVYGRDYKSLPFRLDSMQIIGENANQLANSINNKINTLVEDKLAQIDNSVHAYPNADSIKQAYPNGKLGIFVAVDTGHQWYWVNGSWKDGGFYQASAPIDDIRAVDAKATSNANLLKSLLADFTKEVTERKKIDADLIDKVASYLTALELKEVRLRDEQNKLLWDGNNYVTGNAYLPKTDKTGLEEGLPVDSSIIGYTFLGHLEEYGLPILKLESPDLLSLQTKADGKLSGVKFDYNPNGFEGRTTHETGTLKSIKVQGSSSAGYPKKNYTLNFENDVKFKSTWGYHHKYVIKADWVDFSHMRNEFGAWLFGQIRKTNLLTLRDKLTNESGNALVNVNGDILVGETDPAFLGPNFGAIDSYPVLVVVNGIYHGLYSMTVPKDDWMANLGKNPHDAIISCGFGNDFGQLAKVDSNGNLNDDKWEVEFVTDENNQTWLATDLNNLINKVINFTSIEELEQLIDVQSVIDYYVFNSLIANEDAITHNWLLQKSNGGKWRMVAYDMDSSLGMWWNGQEYQRADSTGIKHQADFSKLFGTIYNHASDRLKERWNDLRKNLLSDLSLNKSVYDFSSKIPKSVLEYEAKRWPSRPGTNTSNVNQIQNWLTLRTNYLDKEFNEL